MEVNLSDDMRKSAEAKALVGKQGRLSISRRKVNAAQVGGRRAKGKKAAGGLKPAEVNE